MLKILMTDKLSKSWKLTLATIIIAIIVNILPAFGIDGISESMVENMIFLALGVSAIGAGNKIGKKFVKPQTHREIETYSGDGWYTTNIDTKSYDKGNGIKHGTKHLTIYTSKVRTYFSVKLLDGNDNVLQIGQSTAGIAINILLADKNGALLPKGDYTLVVTGDYGTSDSVSVTDRFSII